MFTGAATVRIEKQGRFKLPAAFVRQWEERGHGPEVHVTTLLDRRLLIYPQASFDALQRSLLAQAREAPHWGNTADVLNANGAPSELDREHRLALPSHVRLIAARHLGFAPPQEALLVGHFDHLELRLDVVPVQLISEAREHLHELRIPPLNPAPSPRDGSPGS